MVWRLLKKLGIKPPYDPEIPLLGIYPKETKTERDIYPIVHCSTIYNKLEHGSNLDVRQQMNG